MSWPLVALGDIAPAKPIKLNGYTPSDRIWQVTLDQIESNTGFLLEKSIKPLSEAGSSTHAFDERHVLYSKLRPYLNKVLLPDGTGVGTTELVPMLPASGKLDRVYLAHYLKSKTFVHWISSQTAGAKMPRVSMNTFWEHEIPLPPLPDQKRIAAILDKADSLRRKNQQAIQLADQFLRAVFLDLFGDPVTNPKGWGEVELKEIATIRSGVTKGKKIDLLTAVSLPYMRVANVQDGYLDLNDIQNITVSLSDAEKCQLEKGDILLTEGGDPDKLGRGYIWNNEIQNCIHQNHIFSVRIIDQNKIRPEFLSAIIASQRGKRYFLKVGKQTTGIATINKSVLSEFKPIIPPVEIQDKFISAVNKVKRIKKLFPESELNLFYSLSQKAFSGKL